MTSLADRIQSAWSVLAQALAERPHGFLAFSGGKDSTTLLVLAVEFLRRERPEGIRLEVLYADTRLEIPPMARHAFRMLEHTRAVAEEERLPVGIHVVRAPAEESFWSLMLGRGYPAPGFRFRWCTDRLKVRPMNRLARVLCPNSSSGVMFVGVRDGESAERDRRLKNACGRGECGPAKGGSHERVEVEAVCGEPGNRSARVLLRVRQAVQARVSLCRCARPAPAVGAVLDP